MFLNKKIIIKSVLSIACCAAAVASDDSKVLVTMDSKPLITQQQLEQNFDQHAKDYPMFTFWKESDGNHQKKLDRFLEIMVRKAVINKYIHDNKIDASAAYQQALKKEIDKIKLGISAAYFVEHASEDEREKASNISSDEAAQEFINNYISENKIDRLPSYQEKFQQIMNQWPIELMKEDLNEQYFAQQVPIPLEASDVEVQKHYDEHKEFYESLYGPSFPEQMKESFRKRATEAKHEKQVDAEIDRLKKEYKIEVVGK